MTSPRFDDLPPEWLAAYADGELTAAERARVERWLAEYPEARELLDAQESLGPGNTEFWQAVRPPEPSAAEWAAARERIDATPPEPRKTWAGWLGTIGLVATAASLVLLLPPADRPCPDRHRIVEEPQTPTPRSEEEPFPMAMADDVRILSLPETAANFLVIGEHPLRDSLLQLARFHEIEFHGIGSDLAGRFPEVPSDPHPEDVPMIWAPREP
jgi:hypothetical protein